MTKCGIMPAEYISLCAMCGHALTKYEVGADIRGQFIDYSEVGAGEISIAVCRDCWNKLLEIQNNGLDAAIKKRERLICEDRWAVKQIPPFERYGDDDDTPIP